MSTDLQASEAGTYVKSGLINVSVLAERAKPQEILEGCLVVARHALAIAEATADSKGLTPDTVLLREVREILGKLSVIHNS